MSPEQHAAEPVGGDRFGDVFLVIDGFEAVRQDYEAIEPAITEIAARGLAFGVHVVLAASRWTTFRPALKDHLGCCVELRLGDPAESILGRRQALAVPVGSPGRGMTPDGLHMLIALPRLDTGTAPAGMAEGIAAAIRDIGARAGDLSAPEVRMLPVWVTREEMLLRAGDRLRRGDPGKACLSFPIGLDDSDLAPVLVDFSASPHMLVFGDVESGETNLLRLLMQGICGSNTPDQAKIVLVDLRRGAVTKVRCSHRSNPRPCPLDAARSSIAGGWNSSRPPGHHHHPCSGCGEAGLRIPAAHAVRAGTAGRRPVRRPPRTTPRYR